jgi:hypothetical protein
MHGVLLFKLGDAKIKPLKLAPGGLDVCCHSLVLNPSGFLSCETLRLMPNEAEFAQSYQVEQQFKFREAHLKVVGENLIGKVKETTLRVEISEGLFKGLNSDSNPYIKEFILKTHFFSLKSILAINLAGSFELLLIDA